MSFHREQWVCAPHSIAVKDSTHLPTRQMEANTSTDYLLRHKIDIFGSIDLRQDFSCATRELRQAVLAVGKDAMWGRATACAALYAGVNTSWSRRELAQADPRF